MTASVEQSVSAVEPTAGESTPEFAVHLVNFEGPFDLLLSLISKHKLDITEVSLSRVTDEFIEHVKAGGKSWDLEVTTSFLLVASTLLDLKAARLLPQGDIEDEEDLALLEARDLLFARLIQYRAVQAGRRRPGRAPRGRVASSPAGGRARGPLRRAAARGADRHRAGAVRAARGAGHSSRSRCSRSRCTTSTPPR